MATKSIIKAVELKERKLSRQFVRALEEAKEKKSLEVQYTRSVREIKKDKIGEFFR